jgi:hypothetical protein
MAMIDEPLVLSRTALALLQVARENDRSGAMASNAALEAVIEFAEPLARACRDSDQSRLLKLLNLDSAPKNFLELVAAILRQIRDQLNKPARSDGLSTHFARDFDRHVLQGFAEALADLAWPDRKAKDFDGPSLNECCARLAECDASEFWLAATQHYLANIFQHYFAAARVREHFRNLDPLVESSLRLKDARTLAGRVLVIASEMNEREPSPSARIAKALESVLHSVEGEYTE